MQNIAGYLQYMFEKCILVYINYITLLRCNGELFCLSINFGGSCKLFYKLVNLNYVLSNWKELCKENQI